MLIYCRDRSINKRRDNLAYKRGNLQTQLCYAVLDYFIVILLLIL